MKKIYTLFLALMVSVIAFAQSEYSLTVKIDHPERVTLTSYYLTIPNPLTEEMVFEYAYDYGNLTVSTTSSDYFIKSIVDDSGNLLEKTYGSYYIPLDAAKSDGNTYTITTGDINTEPKSTCYVTVDEPSKIKFTTSTKLYDYLNENWEAAPALNEIEFVEGLESPFQLKAGTNEYNTRLYKVMVDGKEIFPNDNNSYNVPASDGSKINITYAFPEEDYTLTLVVPEGISVDQVVETAVAYYEYDTTPLEVSSAIAVPAGRYVSLGISGGFNFSAYSINDGEMLNAGYGRNNLRVFVDKDTKIVFEGELYKMLDVTVNVDNASCVRAYNYITYSEQIPLELTDGKNSFSISEGTPTLWFYPSDAGVIKSVTDETGKVYTKSYWEDYYEVRLTAEGPSTINIETEAFSTEPVKVTLLNEEFKFGDIVTSVKNADKPEEVVEVVEDGFIAQPGQYYTFTFNEDDFSIDHYECYYYDNNGDETSLFEYGWPKAFQVIAGGTIWIEAIENPVYTFTLTVETPDIVEVYRGDSWNGNLIEGFEAGVPRQFEWKSPGYPKVSVRIPEGYYASIFDKTNEIKLSPSFVVDNGYDVVISAAEYDRSAVTTFFIKDLANADYGVYLRNPAEDYLMYDYNDDAKFAEGYNHINFDPKGDTPLFFRANGYENFYKENVFVYLNDEPVANEYAYYGDTFEAHLDLKDGDIVKAFLNEEDGEPAMHDIAFEVEGDKNFTVKKDFRRELADLSAVKAHAGTQFHIIPNEGADIEVSVNDTPVALAEGAHSFVVDGPATVKIVGEKSGIGNIAAEAVAADKDVYNLQGIKVLNNANDDQLKALPAGIYIQGGKKIVVK